MKIVDAWSGINACYNQSIALCESAKLLHENKQYITSSLLSIYAIEEAEKGLRIMSGVETEKCNDGVYVENNLFYKHWIKLRLKMTGSSYYFSNIHEAEGKALEKRHKDITHVDYRDNKWLIPVVDEIESKQYLEWAEYIVKQLEQERKNPRIKLPV